MSEKTKDDELVVTAGYVTVKKQVGAGMAYVDIAQGEPVGDIDDETRDRLVKQGAIGRRDGKPYGHVDDIDPAKAARPVPGEVEPDEIDRDIVPGGTIEQIMAWIGDDLARARVARHEEEAKGDKARATLLKRIDERKAKLETEPPEVPEHYTGDVHPAPVGGVAVPLENPSEGEGKPADGKDNSGS